MWFKVIDFQAQLFALGVTLAKNLVRVGRKQQINGFGEIHEDVTQRFRNWDCSGSTRTSGHPFCRQPRSKTNKWSAIINKKLQQLSTILCSVDNKVTNARMPWATPLISTKGLLLDRWVTNCFNKMERLLSSETVVFVTDRVVRGHNKRYLHRQTDGSVACCVGVKASPSSSIMENTDSDSFLLYARCTRLFKSKIHPLCEYLVLLLSRTVYDDQKTWTIGLILSALDWDLGSRTVGWWPDAAPDWLKNGTKGWVNLEQLSLWGQHMHHKVRMSSCVDE